MGTRGEICFAELHTLLRTFLHKPNHQIPHESLTFTIKVGDWSGLNPGSIFFTLMCLSTVTVSLGLFAIAYYYINREVRANNKKWETLEQNPTHGNSSTAAPAYPKQTAVLEKPIFWKQSWPRRVWCWSLFSCLIGRYMKLISCGS